MLIASALRLLGALVGSHRTSTDNTWVDNTISAPISSGVTVCSLENLSFFPFGCLSADASVGVKSGAVLCYTGLDGAPFAGTKVLFTVRRLTAAGKVQGHGTSSSTVSTSDSSSCTVLSDLISTANLTMTPGNYTIDARMAGTDLGSTVVTLTAAVK